MSVKLRKIKLTHDEYNESIEAAERQGERRAYRHIKNTIKNVALALFIFLVLVLLVLAIVYLWRALF